jgi:hypothetical protein
MATVDKRRNCGGIYIRLTTAATAPIFLGMVEQISVSPKQAMQMTGLSEDSLVRPTKVVPPKLSNLKIGRERIWLVHEHEALTSSGVPVVRGRPTKKGA